MFECLQQRNRNGALRSYNMSPQQSALIVPEQPRGGTIRVPVLGIFDGDGFSSRMDASAVTENPLHQGELEFTARFGFIDAPELGQPGGHEAKAFLKSLIGGRWVDLAILMKMDTGGIRDRHGRIVCTPYLAEQYSVAAFGASASHLHETSTFGHPLSFFRNIELEMVVNGWAWVLERYGPDARYLEALADAQRNRRGIWAFEDNISPWEFKRRKYRAYQISSGHEPKVQCPKDRCGGHLVRRVGKFGAFCGCSNFPICRYSKAITVP